MTDYCFFKYRPVNKYFLDSLVTSQLYFAPRAQLNDPFDCNVDIARSLDRILKSEYTENIDLLRAFRSDDEAIKRFQEGVDGLGIGSFSLTLHETLMWSHYSDDHKGVCVRYDFPKDTLDNEEEILGVSKVSYEPNTVSDWLKVNIVKYQSNHPEFIMELLKVILTSKAPSWRYEKEGRIIRPNIETHTIPRSTLTHIIFGLQTSPADKRLIRSIAEKYY